MPTITNDYKTTSVIGFDAPGYSSSSDAWEDVEGGQIRTLGATELSATLSVNFASAGSRSFALSVETNNGIYPLAVKTSIVAPDKVNTPATIVSDKAQLATSTSGVHLLTAKWSGLAGWSRVNLSVLSGDDDIVEWTLSVTAH